MMSKLLAITLALALLNGALAHNWLITPDSRTCTSTPCAQASTKSPCDATYNAKQKVTPVFAGEPLQFSWSTNHSGPHKISIFPRSSEAGGFTAGSIYTMNFPVGTPSGSFVWPDNAGAPGDIFVLRYNWSGYNNCANLIVLAKPPANAVVADPKQPYTYAVENGSFNALTGQATCVDGYTPASDGTCQSPSGTSSGAVAAGVTVPLLLVGAAGIGWFVYKKRTASSASGAQAASAKPPAFAIGQKV